nr:proline-rich receptor-like protein kinase PERK8 [Aegilops tauschii subsp. strangulata]
MCIPHARAPGRRPARLAAAPSPSTSRSAPDLSPSWPRRPCDAPARSSHPRRLAAPGCSSEAAVLVAPPAIARLPCTPAHEPEPLTSVNAPTRLLMLLLLPSPPLALHPPPPGRAGSARPRPRSAGARWHPRPQPPCARSLPSPCPRRPTTPVAACACGHRASPVRPARLHRVVACRRTRARGSGPLCPATLFRPALVRPLAAGTRARLCRVTWAGYARTLGLRPVSLAPTPATPNTR